jgi:hypothetical protein
VNHGERSTGPSASLVRAQVEAIRQKTSADNPRVFGIRAEGGWSGPTTLDIDGQSFRVVACRSPLEVRERLAETDGSDQRLIVITSVGDDDLGEDVLARLAKRRLFALDTWESAARLFQSTRVDPRLRRESWMAAALIESAPPGGYPSVPAGLLDRETAWTAFLRHRLEFTDGRPDAVALLSWTLASAGPTKFTSLNETGQHAVVARFEESAGAAGAAIGTCIEAGHASMAVPIGLVLDATSAPVSSDEVGQRLREGVVRLERYTGGRPVPAAAVAQWAAAAGLALREMQDQRLVSEAIAHAEALMQAVGLADITYLSDWLPSGLDQRLAQLADSLTMDAGGARLDFQSLVSRLRSVERHRLAAHHPQRVRRAEMAVRLLRWLGTLEPPAEHAPLTSIVAGYIRELALVDLARVSLRAGDSLQPLAHAYGSVVARIAERRERENRRFGAALSSWISTGSTSGELMPVEEVLSRVVAPLAKLAPLLMIVVDGMSMAVWREISEDLSRSGWLLLNPADGALPPGLATVPSVTQYSRASLLSGRLASGTSADEKRAFEAHPGLVAASRQQYPPVIFHKADLAETGGRSLAEDVRQAITFVDRRVIAVVLNAVDDHLAKADQVRVRWSLEYVPLVAALLHEARSAGRVVVFVSDHGHLLDDETQMERSEYGDRWRAAEGELGEGEVLLSGPRVKAAGGRVIVPWSERTRYGMRKNGYHGGATPQEMIVPVAVVASGTSVAGWIETALSYPDWWEEPLPAMPVPSPVDQVPAPPPPSRKSGAPLFEVLEAPPVPAAEAAVWIDQLFISPVFSAQKRLAGRVAPHDHQLRALLVVLDERGGKMTRAALAHRLAMPLVRIGGFIAAARRVLNVEGYAVLGVDDASDTVELNRALLATQFEIGNDAGARGR